MRSSRLSARESTRLRVGTAGWSIPRETAGLFPAVGPVLSRYAAILPGVEINTSFYRPHRRATYERWAKETPPGFAFAVKAPKSVTHEARLRDAKDLVRCFLDEIAGLGGKLGPVLIQTPPSLPFDDDALRFLELWRSYFDGETAWEPRHRTWFTSEADSALEGYMVARVAADPALGPEAARPGGWSGLAYLRLHGSPQVYASAYVEERITELTAPLRDHPNAWCIFDNTQFGAATRDALTLSDSLRRGIQVTETRGGGDN